MAYRYGERNQAVLFPQSIDEYIEKDAPVRAYDVIVDSMNIEELGIDLDPHKVGCPQYDPKAMLKLLVYGYSYGVRSSRKLEREVHYNLSFIWLTGGLKPDHKTIAEFRRRNKSVLQKVLKQCAKLCIRLGLIEGNTLFVDGSKIKANASLNNNWTKRRCEKHLKDIDKRIKEILLECEAVDDREKQQKSLIKMAQELKDQQTLKSKVENILNELEAKNKKSTNTTDPDSKRMFNGQRSYASYNTQTVIDEKHGLVVNSDVVSECNDLRQFAEQIEQAQETLGKKCNTACADAGYSTAEELERVDRQGIKVIVPSQKQAAKKRPGPFDQSGFKYIPQEDVYICPTGHELPFVWNNWKAKRCEYAADIHICRACEHFGLCTKDGKYGRRINRNNNERFRDRMRAQYLEAGSQKIYRLRKQKVELPFGHIRRNLQVDSFLLRGLNGVKAEMSLLASCFNIARMVTIFGVNGLIAKLS